METNEIVCSVASAKHTNNAIKSKYLYQAHIRLVSAIMRYSFEYIYIYFQTGNSAYIVIFMSFE